MESSTRGTRAERWQPSDDLPTAVISTSETRAALPYLEGGTEHAGMLRAFISLHTPGAESRSRRSDKDPTAPRKRPACERGETVLSPRRPVVGIARSAADT